jgi:hypothetical protein
MQNIICLGQNEDIKSTNCTQHLSGIRSGLGRRSTEFAAFENARALAVSKYRIQTR